MCCNENEMNEMWLLQLVPTHRNVIVIVGGGFAGKGCGY